MRTLTTALDLAGVAAISTGAALIYGPLGLLVGGGALLLASWHLAPRTPAVPADEEPQL